MMITTEKPNATKLVLRRTYDATPERLYAAWTTPAAMEKFFGPNDVKAKDITVDLRVGGSYSITMLHSDGDAWRVGGVYKEVVPNQRVSFTWSWDEDDATLARETLVTLEFRPRGDKTELVLTHENFRDEEQRDKHNVGWSAIMEGLAPALATIGPVVRIEGIDMAGFMVKDAARAMAFYRECFGMEPAIVYPENRGAEYELPDGSSFGLWGGGGASTIPFQPSNSILFAVRDLDASVATLESRGVAIVQRIETPVCRMALLQDTEGNTVALHQRHTN